MSHFGNFGPFGPYVSGNVSAGTSRNSHRGGSYRGSPVSSPVNPQPTDGFSNDDGTSDEWYLNYISQYKGTDWYQQLLNNPHLRANSTPFSPDLWQQFLESIGDYSARDRYYGDLLSKRNDYLSKIEDEMRQYKQNSPANRAALMGAAGQNADLLGTSGVAGAPENDNLPEPFLPSQSSGSGIESIKTFAGMCMQAYQFASGIAHDVVGLNAEFSRASEAAADAADKHDSLAMKFLRSGIGTPRVEEDDQGNKHYVFPDLSLQKLNDYASDNFHSSRQRRQFIGSVKNAYGTARHQFEKYGLITDAEKARFAMSQSMGLNEAYGMSYEAPHDNDPLIVVSRGMSKAVKEVQDLELKSSKAEQKYSSDYFHNLDGATAADAANKQNKQSIEAYVASKNQRKVDEIINNSIFSIIRKLSDIANDGGVSGALAKGMILFYSAYRANMLPGLPQINIDRSQKTFVKSLAPGDSK